MEMDHRADEFEAPKDLSHLFSKTTKARDVSKIKQFYKYFAIPGIAQLAGGSDAYTNLCLD
jgi:site-specific recombinase XerD